MKWIIYIAFCLASTIACKTSEDLTGDKPQDDNNGIVSKKEAELKAYFIEAASEEAKGNLDKALVLYQKCLGLDPDNHAVHFELSKVYGQMSELSKSMNHAEKAIEGDPKNIWYLKQAASLYAYSSQFELAASYYKQVVDIDDSPENLLDYVNALVRAGKTEEAIGAISEIEKQVGTNPEIVNQKYQLYTHIGKDKEAMDLMKKAAADHPNDIAYQGMLAAAYEEQGDLESSVATYKKMLELEPNNPRIHMALYRYYNFVGQKKDAMRSLDKIFDSQELDIDDKMKILLDLYEETEVDNTSMPEIYSLLEKLIKTHPEEPKAYSIYGDFLLRDEKEAAARDMFVKALEFDGDRFLIWNQVMYLDMNLAEYEALLEHSEEALEIFPNQPGVYYYNGFALFKKSEYDRAIDALETGKSLVIENPPLMKEFCQTLGDVKYRSEDLTGAFEAYDCVLEIEPNNAFVLNNYAYYLALAGRDLDKAEQMSQKAVNLFPSQASYRDTYAWIQFRKKAYTEAHIAMQKAFENGGDKNPVLVEHMGDILYFLDKKSEAIDYWKQAKELGSESKTLDQKIKEQKYVE